MLASETKLFIECSALAETSPSVIVQLCVFVVSENVLDWFELGSMWAMTTRAGTQCRVYKESDDRRTADRDSLECGFDSPAEQALMSAIRRRLLHLLQYVCRPIMELPDVLGPAQPSRQTAMSALASHFESAFGAMISSMPRSLLLSIAEAAEESDAITACLVDPFFIFSTAWALGGHTVGSALQNAKIEVVLRGCLTNENILRSVAFPTYLGKSQGTIYEFYPKLMQTHLAGKTHGKNVSQSLGESLEAGGILVNDLNVLYADTQSEIEDSYGGINLHRALPENFDLAFAGSLERGNIEKDGPSEPVSHALHERRNANDLVLNPPSMKPRALFQVKWIQWASPAQSAKSDVAPINDPTQILIETAPLFRAKMMLVSEIKVLFSETNVFEK